MIFNRSRQSKAIGRKILFALLPLVLISLIAVITGSYFLIQDEVNKNVIKLMENTSKETVMSLQKFFNQRDTELETIAEIRFFKDYYEFLRGGDTLKLEAEHSRTRLEEYLLEFAINRPAYVLIVYVDKAGVPIVGVENGKPIDATAHNIQTILEQKAHVLAPVVLEGNKHCFYLKEIYDEYQSSMGKLVMSFKFDEVKEKLGQVHQNEAVGKGGVAYLVNESGVRVLGDASQCKIPLKTEAEIEIRDKKWKVVVAADPVEFQEQFHFKFQVLAIVALVFTGVVIPLVLRRSVQKATLPIEEMVTGTQRLAAGELDYRFTPPNIKELEVLAVSFNDMAGKLKTRDMELKTSNLELKTSNRQLTALRDMEAGFIQQLDEEAILRKCLVAIIQGLSFDRAGLYWVDSEQQAVVGRYLLRTEEAGFTESSFRKRSIPLKNDDVLNTVIRTRSALLVKDVEHAPGMNQAYIRESKSHEFVLAPICGKDRVFGIFAADKSYSNCPLDELDKDGLMMFANAAGLALEKNGLLVKLTDSEARHRMVLENSPIAILGLSREHRINTWNRGAEEIFGYRPEEIVGKPLIALMPQGVEGEFKALLADLIEKGSIRDYPIRGVTKGGRPLDLALSWGSSEMDFWMNREWAVVIRDVSEAKKLQLQVVRSEKLSAVGQLISGIAHELNNPLQAVVGFSELLMERASKDTSAKNIRPIVENATRCRKIIDNLLLFVRHGGVDKRPMLVHEVVHASVELIQFKLKKNKVRTEIAVPKDLPCIEGNFQQLQQLIMNLVNNACDALGGWRGRKLISVVASLQESMVRIEITDTGPGIPLDLQTRLFEPFFTTKPEGQGTGLGLSICRQIAADHGGVLEFKSTPGKGTTFWIQLPVSQVEASALPESSAPKIAGNGTSILLVDDDAAVRMLLADILEFDGFRVETASSFDTAKCAIARKEHDIIIADMELGDGTGLQLYEQWRSFTVHPRPAFLILTGDVLNVTLEKKLQANGLSSLYKPIDLKSFRNALGALMVSIDDQRI